MTITGRNATLIIVDESNIYLSNSEALANIRAMLAEFAASECPRQLQGPPEGMSLDGDYSAIELRLLARETAPRWMFQEPVSPRKKPKGPRNRWGGLK